MGRVAGLTAAETRQRVVEAAAVVFAEAGYEGARVSAIARLAGLSTGAIYNHFRSKAEVLAAVVDRYATTELADFLLGDEGPASPGGILDLVAEQGARLQHRKRAASLLVETILAARRDRELARLLARQVRGRERALADLLRVAQSSGEAEADVDADVVARFCLMLGLGSLLVAAMELDRTDTDAWSGFINRLIDTFRRTEEP